MVNLSVCWDSGVDLVRPRVYATAQAYHVLKPQFTQKKAGIHTAHTMVAVNNESIFFIQFIRMLHELRQGDMLRAWDGCFLNLPSLSYIQEYVRDLIITHLF